jgi:hypothetical protein
VAVCALKPLRGHAPAGAEVVAKLTLQLDHSTGAGQSTPRADAISIPLSLFAVERISPPCRLPYV